MQIQNAEIVVASTTDYSRITTNFLVGMHEYQSILCHIAAYQESHIVNGAV